MVERQPTGRTSLVGRHASNLQSRHRLIYMYLKCEAGVDDDCEKQFRGLRRAHAVLATVSCGFSRGVPWVATWQVAAECRGAVPSVL